MPSIYKALRRDRKINRRRTGHQVDGRSVFLLEEEKKKRAEAIKRRREEKEASLEI
jgi:hypothetical protein